MSSLYFKNGQVNHARLKLELYCNGLRLDDSLSLDADARRIIRNRAGLGSGLELIVGKDMAVNTPVVEKWVERSPYVLRKLPEGYAIFRTRDGSPARTDTQPIDQLEKVDAVRVPHEPRWYSQRTSSGKLMSRIGCLQGSYLGVYFGPRCNNWAPNGQPEFCKFCTEGQNLGREEDVDKSVEDVVETAIAARRESGITFVHFNCGFIDGNEYFKLLEPVMSAVKKRTGLLVGMQAPPDADFENYRRAKAIGVNNVSFCFEVLDEVRFAEIGPGKARRAGLKRYLDAIDHCANVVGFDTVNGEIIAGLEPVESSIRAVDWIVDHGAIPTVCVHRPLFGAAYQHLDPPNAEEILPVFVRMYDRCIERGLPIGIAPNVHVSLILMPDECRYLSQQPDARPLTRLKNRVMHKVFSRVFNAMVKVPHDGVLRADPVAEALPGSGARNLPSEPTSSQVPHSQELVSSNRE